MVAIKKEKNKFEKKLLAIIRIRGQVNVNESIKKTMIMLRLHRKHRCIVLPATKTYMGMLNKIKDFCTFGEIDRETFSALLEKRGRIAGDKSLTEKFIKDNFKMSLKDLEESIFSFEKKLTDFEGIKAYFKLSPPIGGYERKGIKKPYSVGGALGYRGEAINKLIRKMM